MNALEEKVPRIGIIILILAVLFLFCSICYIPTGTVGVVIHNGKVQDVERTSGWHVRSPGSTIHRVSIQSVYKEVSQSVLLQDGSHAFVTLALVYRISPEQASDIYRDHGVLNTRISAAIAKETVQTIFLTYGANDLLGSERRASLETIDRDLHAELAKWGIELLDTMLVDMQLDIALSYSCLL